MVAQISEQLPVFDKPRVEPAPILRIKPTRFRRDVLRLCHAHRLPVDPRSRRSSCRLKPLASSDRGRNVTTTSRLAGWPNLLSVSKVGLTTPRSRREITDGLTPHARASNSWVSSARSHSWRMTFMYDISTTQLSSVQDRCPVPTARPRVQFKG